MRILLVSDIHFPNNKSIGITPSEEITECINLFKLIEESIDNIDMVLFLGDIFDTPDKSTSSAMSLLVELFRRLATLKPIIIITGNHDCSSTDQQNIDGIKYYDNQLSVLANIPNITVINEPKVCEIDNNEIVLMPYRNNTKEAFKNLKLDKNKNKICFGHFEVFGTNDYQELIEDNDSMISLDELCNLGFSSIICGHIHNSIRKITSNDNNTCELTYLGSSRNINFNNTGMTPEIAIVNIDNDGLVWEEHVINPYTCIYKTFDNLQSLKNYIMTFTEECLSKTKVKYRYKTEDELKYINEIKNEFKSFKIEKSLESIVNDNGSVISKEEVEELGSLLQNNLVNNDNIKEYCYKFSPIEDTKETDKIMDIIRRNK